MCPLHYNLILYDVRLEYWRGVAAGRGGAGSDRVGRGGVGRGGARHGRTSGICHGEHRGEAGGSTRRGVELQSDEELLKHARSVNTNLFHVRLLRHTMWL